MNKTYLISLAAAFLLLGCAAEPQDLSPRSIGNPNASVVIEEFSDLQCPACAAISPQVEAMVRRNSNIVRLDYYHFPLSYHEYAFRAAEAAECAGDQGKFWEFVDTAFKRQDDLSEPVLRQIVRDLNLDEQAFNQCFDGRKKRAKVAAHLAEGKSRSVPGTPSFFVNGKLTRFGSLETFEAYVKSLAN